MPKAHHMKIAISTLLWWQIIPVAISIDDKLSFVGWICLKRKKKVGISAFFIICFLNKGLKDSAVKF
jgi:hypothetical protein